MRPNSIKLFEIFNIVLFITATIDSVIQIYNHYGPWLQELGADTANVRTAISLLIDLLINSIALVLALLISRLRNKVAFWLFTGWCIILILGAIGIIFDSFTSYQRVRAGLSIILESLIMIQLYHKDSRNWIWIRSYF